MQAIIVKYVGPTATKKGRMVARCEDGRTVVSFDHALDTDDNARAAARALILKLGWGGNWVDGSLGNDRVFVWVGDNTLGRPLFVSKVAS
jgi:hypothetical protein